MKKPARTTSRATQRKTAKKETPTRQWLGGFILLFFAFYLFISTFSFILFWKTDQAVAKAPLSETKGVDVANWGGRLGTKIGDLLVSDSFGLFGLLIPLVLFVLALRVLKYRPVMLDKSVRIGLMAMIIGSVTFGYIGNLFGGENGVFGTGLGGKHGIFIAQWIESYISYGTGLLLLVLIVFLAIYIDRNTISLLNRFGRGIADKSKDLTQSFAGKATELITHRREEEVGESEEGSGEEKTEVILPAEAGTAEPVEAGKESRKGFLRRMFGRSSVEGEPGESATLVPDSEVPVELSANADFDFGQERVQLMEPAVKRKFVPEREEEDDFIVRTLGEEEEAEERPMPQIELESRDESMNFREYTDSEGFIIREPVTREEPGPEAGPDDSVGPSDPEEFRSDENDEDPGLSEGEIRMDENFTVEVAREDESLPDDMIDSGFYDHTLDLSSYQRPPVELLDDHHVDVHVTSEELRENKNRIIETLENFGIKIESIKATVGPTVTLYEIVPAPGVRISKIKNLENDIALSLAALGIRIIAPIPGKGTIGIEVPNKDKEVVSMYSAVKSVKFQETGFDLPVVLGRTIQNENYVIDLAKMPHLLVAGATGQGKSVGLNALITSLLYKKHPSELKFVMVDPKKVELTLYGKLEKHFLAKMSSEEEAIITDTQKVVYTLNSICIEMDSRYDLLKNAGVRNLKEYNEKFTRRRLNPEKGHRYLPYIVVIIDEYADLLVTAGREIETPLARIAQLARAVGIHLVIATQRPTADVITGLIKSNIPARIAFRVTSMMNSRTILDQPGAEQLIGRGDMLVSTGGDVIRVQCAFVDTPEIERIMEFISNQRGYVSAYELPEYVPEGEGSASEADLTRRDALFEEAARLVVSGQQGSTSLIQRKFSIGYNRAGRIMDQLEAAGIVGRSEGSKPREVRITDMASLEFMLENMNHFN